jgi:hypothetical protein
MTAVVSRHRAGVKPPLAALVWSVAAVSLAGLAAAWVLAGHNRDLLHITADSGPDRFLVAYPVVGAVLASRRPSNPIGWFLLGMGLVAAARGLAGEYALDTLTAASHPAAGVWAAWFVSSSLTLAFPAGLLLFALLLFPDGQPLTPRRWLLGWLAAGLNLVLQGVLVPLANKFKTGQVAYSLAVVAGLGLALPLAIGVAVLKYRLYAIDKIISRTVSYALVTGLVVGVYVGCVVLLSHVLPVRGSVGVAVAVLVAAALFNPLRRRVQAVVDRRFDRARYDAERVVAQFSVQLREQVDLDVLGADLLEVVHHVLAPEHLALWLNDTVSPAAEHPFRGGRAAPG